MASPIIQHSFFLVFIWTFLQVRSELVFFFVLHEGVEVAKATYGLVREW